MSLRAKNLWGWLWKDGRDPSEEPPPKIETNIKKARQVISEIEDIIKREIDFVESPADDPVPSLKKRTVAPTLIKPLNKKKNKMVVGNMEFDPVRQTWLGNEDALKDFSKQSGPALITHVQSPRGAPTSPVVTNGMTWDPVNKKWLGNDKDTAHFPSSNRPALISQLNPSSIPTMPIAGNMTFDQERMIWVGNETELDAFSGIQTAQSSNDFSVGTEFSLTNEMKAHFKRRESDHTASLSGWIPPMPRESLVQLSPGPEQTHLFAIRSMSIIRIVNQAKYGYVPVGPTSPRSDKDRTQVISSPMPKRSQRSHSLNLPGTIQVENQDQLIDTFEDGLDFSGPALTLAQKLKKPSLKALVVSGSEDSDWDESDTGEDGTTRVVPFRKGLAHSAPDQADSDEPLSQQISSGLSKFQDEEGDDMYDMDVPIPRAVSRDRMGPERLSFSSVSSERSIGFSSDEDNFSDSVQKDELDGLDIPKHPKFTLKNQLEFNMKNRNERAMSSSDQEGAWGFSEDSDKDERWIVERDRRDSIADLSDIELPSLQQGQRWMPTVKNVTNSTSNVKTQNEELAGLELPTEISKLELKRPTLPMSQSDTEDEWSDIEFPFDKKLTLKSH